MQETQVPFTSWEDPLEKKMAIHSSNLAWEISWAEEPGGLQSMGYTKSWITLRLNSNNDNNNTGRQGKQKWKPSTDKKLGGKGLSRRQGKVGKGENLLHPNVMSCS